MCTIWKRQNISHLTNIRESFSSPRFTICAISSLFPDKHLKNFQRCLYGHFKLSHWYQSHYRSHKSHQVILYPPGIFTLMDFEPFFKAGFFTNQSKKLIQFIWAHFHSMKSINSKYLNYALFTFKLILANKFLVVHC